MYKFKPLVKLVIPLVLFGCSTQAEMGKKGDDEGSSGYEGSTTEHRYFPFRIALSLKGEIVVLDDTGREIQLQDVDLPLSTSKLYSLETVTIGVVEGSCNVLVKYGNVLKQKTYPDSVCQALGLM